jgi:periplasmic divalent cation tolerance protein
MLTIAYIPCGSEREAMKIGEALVKERLAACGNIFQSRSIYEWKGDIKSEKEWVVFAKTVPEKFDELKKMVEEIHSYDLPCIIAIPVNESNEGYLDWVQQAVR